MKVYLHHTMFTLAMTDTALRQSDLIVSLFAVFAPCATLLMGPSLPLSNGPASHCACPKYRYTVLAKVRVLERGNVQLNIRAETVTEEIRTPIVLLPPSGPRSRKADHNSTLIGLKLEEEAYSNRPYHFIEL
jgi:hypothetical protein